MLRWQLQEESEPSDSVPELGPTLGSHTPDSWPHFPGDLRPRAGRGPGVCSPTPRGELPRAAVPTLGPTVSASASLSLTPLPTSLGDSPALGS